MTKILIYGDSFSSCENSFCWPFFLKDQYNVELRNKAISGSSTENAMIEFESSIRNNEIDDEDIIIFQLSTPGRFYLEFQRNHPNTASMFFHPVSPDQPQYRWWKENKNHIDWYLGNFDNHVNIINHECYIHVMKNYAESFPNRKVMVLQNTSQDIKFPILRFPANFLMPNIDLNKIAENEIINFESYNNWSKYTGWDFRENHLSIPNRQTLVNLIYESLQTGNTDNFSYDKFQKNIFRRIENFDQYLHYVTNGYLNDDPRKRYSFQK